jgi:NAD(P)-dependent dehydrogenase (short-subunit alcohol dehydrogenase family)
VGKVVLVTGGTRGIGRGIADRFEELGADVIVCARRPVDADRRFIAADLRDPDQIDALFATIAVRHRRLDVLINNAGGSPPAEAATASPRFAEKIIALNLLAPLWASQAANRMMQTQHNGGAIINIASVSGTRASPGTAAYGAAKAGVINLTKSLAIEWAPRVRVNAVTPGLVETESSALHYGDADGVARVAATVPLGRLAIPQDVANACAYLASPLSNYITGANLVLDGGGEMPAFLRAARRD